MLAGRSLPKNTTNLVGDEAPNHTWNEIPSTNFKLRVGPNYHSTKAKSTSPPCLMEVVGVDCVNSPERIDNFASRVTFPAEWKVASDLVPSIFVVNVQLPSTFPTSVFTEIKDGPGWSLVFYFRWTEAALQALSSPGTDPTTAAAKMLEQFTNSGSHVHHEHTKRDKEVKDTPEHSKWKGRFKVILNCNNIDDFGLPSFISSYNAKPVLIRNTGTLLRAVKPAGMNAAEAAAEFDGVNNGVSYAEFDINVHRFASVPKKALQMLLGRFNQMSIDIGFCIESRTDEEMPETLLGCVAINHAEPNDAPTI